MRIELAFEDIWPPTTNLIWRAGGRNGHAMHLSAAATRFRTAVANAILIERSFRKIPPGQLDGDLSVEIRFMPPDARRRDIDNPIKSVLDAMTHAGLWWDDSQIKRLLVVMCAPAKDRKGFELVVEELNG